MVEQRNSSVLKRSIRVLSSATFLPRGTVTLLDIGCSSYTLHSHSGTDAVPVRWYDYEHRI